MPSVSIIVPVYNVEKYLPLCLDSLQAQTLKDIEIILIDDGSTDSCGAICDKYAAADNRFKVYHTENRGLSAARNLGIQNANSDYLMFVDSDDWVPPLFCEIPYTAAKEYNADIVIFQRKNTTEKGRIKRNRKVKPKPTGIITKEEAIDYGTMLSWNKLYNRNLFSNIRFPEDHVYEDVAITHKLIYQASCIVMLPDILIYHRIRPASISHTRLTANMHDCFSYRIARYRDLISYGYPEEKAKKSLQKSAMTYCIQMPPSDDCLYLRAEELLSEIEGIPRWSKKRKICFILWKNNKRLFHLIFKLSRQKVKE